MDLGFSGEMLFIFLLALLLFGPKKLPEIGRQVGRLLAEFRRASNELKGQLENEMRMLEAEEQQKKIAPAPPASAGPPEGTVMSSGAGSGDGEPPQLSAAASVPGDLTPVVHDDDPPPHPGPGVESA
jgi:sec-independent protein translocase protein TatB